MGKPQTVKPGELIDQAERDRFTTETGTNFSVIAPAGVGKTTSIVSRIVNIAKADAGRSEKVLPRLVLVTYTRKAATEMQQRAYARLLESNVGADVVGAFGQAFFGTIHSFCLELLKEFGPLVGLPPAFEQVEDTESLWLEFLRSRSCVLEWLPPESRTAFTQLVPLEKVWKLAKELAGDEAWLEAAFAGLEACPKPRLDALLSFEPSGNKRGLPGILEMQGFLREWKQRWAAGEVNLGLPSVSKGSADFKELAKDVFGELSEWAGRASLIMAAGAARDFRAFRVQRAQVSFDDQISLARELVRHPEVGALVRERRYSVILDEAQDTDPRQFDVLLGVASEEAAQSLEPADWRPGRGRFSMVGDPQQSIYSDRADLVVYRHAHESLCACGVLFPLTFQVTMRCSSAVVACVNELFPNVLTGRGGEGGQVDFVPLTARPDAVSGAVQCVQLEPGSFVPDNSSTKGDVEAASRFATWLKAAGGPAALGADDWSEVAVICPRNQWLSHLDAALRRQGLPVQAHSRRDVRGDQPVFAWLSGLAAVFAHPDDGFELAGVLRELYGISDDAIARFCGYGKGKGGRWALRADGLHPLQILRQPEGDGVVAAALKGLVDLRTRLVGLPLSEAVRLLVRESALIDRIEALPAGACRVEEQELLLEQLVMQATAMEEQGLTFADWSGWLERDFSSRGDEAEPKPGHIQLFSCHKSKGLEWQVVLMPFFFKKVAPPGSEYPRVYPAAFGKLPQAAVDPSGADGECEELVKQRKRAENQRLLYVACTRAKRRLILFDDAGFWKKQEDSLGDALLALGGQAPNRHAFISLPPFKAAADGGNRPGQLELSGIFSEDAQPELSAQTGSPPRVWPDLPFVKRVLPSSLALHDAAYHERDEKDVQAEPEFPELKAEAARDGADYGNWWHNTMETLPWGEDPDAWNAHAEAAFAACPQPERGRSEWACFAGSDTAHLLATRAETVRAEVPMLWPDREGAAYDGFIDLLAEMDDGSCLVLDWKTDRIPPAEGVEALLEIYGPQVRVYVRAISAAMGVSVRGLLYSTRVGQSVELTG